jgi:hypothetical protein
VINRDPPIGDFFPKTESDFAAQGRRRAFIELWARALAPITFVASLRETSILFGVMIAVLVLREPLRTARVATALIVCGLVLIRLQ